MSSENVPYRSVFLGNAKVTPLSFTSGPDESVASTTRELSQGEYGSTTSPTSNPSSLMTMINVGK